MPRDAVTAAEREVCGILLSFEAERHGVDEGEGCVLSDPHDLHATRCHDGTYLRWWSECGEAADGKECAEGPDGIESGACEDYVSFVETELSEQRWAPAS
jgi:hypothetical protein